MTMELGTYGSLIKALGWLVVKSLRATYWDEVLAMYKTVLLVPTALIVMGLEVRVLPFPKSPPIWPKGAGLHTGRR